MPCPIHLRKYTQHATPSPQHNNFSTTNPHTTNPYNTSRNNTPVHYTHPDIIALTLNTRGIHTTILDLQSLLNTQPMANIIALTETKHRHV